MTDREQEAAALIESVRDYATITPLSHRTQIEKIEQLRDAMRELLAAHRPTEPDEDAVAELAKTYRPTPGDRDGMARARAALAEPDEDVREALIEGAKLSARNLMRNDPRVWYDALASALDQVLPEFWSAALAACPVVAEAPSDEEALELEVQDLATIIGNVVIDYEDTGPHSQRPITIRDTCSDWPMEIAGEVQAHGFRLAARPVVDAPRERWVEEGPFSEGEYQILGPDRIVAVVYERRDVDRILAARPVVDDAAVVDALTAFYGEERDSWSMKKVRRMRAALAALGGDQ